MIFQIDVIVNLPSGSSCSVTEHVPTMTRSKEAGMVRVCESQAALRILKPRVSFEAGLVPEELPGHLALSIPSGKTVGSISTAWGSRAVRVKAAGDVKGNSYGTGYSLRRIHLRDSRGFVLHHRGFPVASATATADLEWSRHGCGTPSIHDSGRNGIQPYRGRTDHQNAPLRDMSWTWGNTKAGVERDGSRRVRGKRYDRKNQPGRAALAASGGSPRQQ